MALQMVDLKSQYQRLKPEIDNAIQEVLDSVQFINGPVVSQFRESLEQYLGVRHVIPCANGTDALQIAMMALDLKPGDEVIVPAFTYVATAEVIGLLGLTPVMVDVDPQTFNLTADLVAAAITDRTKAIVPVHLFGQCADMTPIMDLARQHNLYVIEDNAQAIGADYASHTPSGYVSQKGGTIGHIGCTSFFPSKNLGCYGDGGAIMTNDDDLAAKMRIIANHGQTKQYYHGMIGINSRLDAIQAAILNVKLQHLEDFNLARRRAADGYDAAFAGVGALVTPVRHPLSSHVFHQYTPRVLDGQRDALKDWLQMQGIPAMIYYPVPLYKQDAYKQWWNGVELPVTEQLCREVISLPMHSEFNDELVQYIADAVKMFFQPS